MSLWITKFLADKCFSFILEQNVNHYWPLYEHGIEATSMKETNLRCRTWATILWYSYGVEGDGGVIVFQNQG